MSLKKGEKTRAQLLEENIFYRDKSERVESSLHQMREELSKILGGGGRDQFTMTNRNLTWMEISCEVGKLIERSNSIEKIIKSREGHIAHLRGEIDAMRNTKKENANDCANYCKKLQRTGF